MTSSSSSALLKAYIPAMANSSLTDRNKGNPMHIDLVISGGAFNGAYAYGVIMYLLELVEQNKLVINNVSGCSAGALCALCAATGVIDLDFPEKWANLKCDCRDNQTLDNLRILVREYVDLCVKKDSGLATLTNKLYITKTDIENGNHEVVSSWNTRDELVDDLISSCFIPYLINGEPRYKERYVDGIAPHIFKNPDRKCMYVDLYSMHNNRWIKCLLTANENNPTQRIVEGLQECCKFLNNEKSYLCTWVDDWNMVSYTVFRLQFLIAYTMVILIEYSRRFQIPSVVKDNPLYKGLVSTLMKLVQDSFYLGQY